MAGEQNGLQVGKLAQRYLPFVAIVVLQLIILAQTPSTKTTTVRAPAGEATTGDQITGSNVQTGAGSDAGGGTSGAVAGGSQAGTASGGAQSGTRGATGTATGAATVAGQTGNRAGAASAGTNQQVDALGRPVSGDKSKCAPGGLVQENVTYAPIPCMPKFEGDNGGATYKGVTGDTVNVVIVFTEYTEGVSQALTAVGLRMTPEQAEESNSIWEKFFNTKYELYGRKINLISHYDACTDAACERAEAKSIVAKYNPFIVAFYAFGIMSEPMADQLGQLGVIALQTPPLSDEWYKRHTPYAVSLEPQGSVAADMVSDYYCKKMQGKNATLAGDPTMRVKKRKFGIISTDSPASAEAANRIKANVSGDMCGGADDGTTLYTLSSDPAQAQSQAPTLITRMKNDGITTRTMIAPWFGSQEDDKQQYYPENLFSGVGNGDDDLVGQFFSKTGSATQAENTFGIGFYPKSSAPGEKEYYKVARSVNPQYEPPYLSQGPFGNAQLAARMIQWAGPTLNAKNVERGMRMSPQLAGWVNPTPWQGWKCCNPLAQMWNFSKEGIYGAWADAREIYWSGSTVSPSNNNPGAWICVNDCRRYPVGGWPKGEPKQAS